MSQNDLDSRHGYFFSTITRGYKITAFRNEITLKAPPGERIIVSPARPAFVNSDYNAEFLLKIDS